MTCTSCQDEFSHWELEPGENQPPRMSGGVLCRSCFDDNAEERRAEEGE